MSSSDRRRDPRYIQTEGMRRIEQIVNRHNKNMLVHFKLYFKKRTPWQNKKIFNETVRSIEAYVDQEVEEKLRFKLMRFVMVNKGVTNILAGAIVDEYLCIEEFGHEIKYEKDDGQDQDDE
jgi:hypothetical protein